jgi:hypothetical protein
VGGYDVQITPDPDDPCKDYVQRSPVAAAARLVEAIYSTDPIAELMGNREQVDAHALLDMVGGRRGDDSLALERNPFESPR